MQYVDANLHGHNTKKHGPVQYMCVCVCAGGAF